MMPISIVDGTGFREFCQELELRYRIPSLGTITNRIEEMYNSTSDNIKELLKDQDVALTKDGWTYLATASYVTATAHWISGDWESYLLQQKQKLLGLKTEKLINHCPTRWNSTYDMICLVSEQQAAVSAVISRMELTTSEWSLMEKVQPFKVATEVLSTDKYPTASAVLPLKDVLLSQLNKQTPDEPEPPAPAIITDLKKRYSEEKGAFMLLNKAS
ncbi:zinc finger BED domain-containing protein 1-like [Scomber scombrus]|uniref:Zinc finger BED domain-containing protein 1-like n=1 Tax=Scomber scombrus TaxID=13677 RepID=A0AAV1Q8U3_SCOSC